MIQRVIIIALSLLIFSPSLKSFACNEPNCPHRIALQRDRALAGPTPYGSMDAEAQVKPEAKQEEKEDAPELTECGICGKGIPKLRSPDVSCKAHPYCAECMKSYFKVELDKGRYSIKCPDPGCKVIVQDPQTADPLLMDVKRLLENKKRVDSELASQSRSTRCFINRQLLKSWGNYICCLALRGCGAETEVCPGCKVIYQRDRGCPNMVHNQCGATFVKNNQINCPCWCAACGCYFPISCQYYSCRTGPKCWCIKI